MAKWLRMFCAGMLACVVGLIFDIYLIPRGNIRAPHTDVIMVLGQPAEPDGSVKGEALERTDEAVREYQAGVAPVILFTGGAAHNRWLESDAMARRAIGEGVAEKNIVREHDSINTIQNIDNASRIMQSHQWKSAEIISSYPHLWRASIIVEALNRLHPELALNWQTHSSPWPPYYLRRLRIQLAVTEAFKCLELQVVGIRYANQLSCNARHDEALSGCLVAR